MTSGNKLLQEPLLNRSNDVSVTSESSLYRNHLVNGTQAGAPKRSTRESNDSSSAISRLREATENIINKFSLPLFICRRPLNLIACLAAVVLTTGEVVFRKAATANMFHYRWFLVQLLSFLTVLAYMAIKCGKAPKKISRVFRSNSNDSLSSSLGTPKARRTNHSPLESKQKHNSATQSKGSEDIKNAASSPEGVSYASMSDIGKTKLKSTLTDTYIHVYKKESFSATWKSCVAVGLLDCLHLFLVFIPLGVVPGPITAILPYLSVAAGLGLDVIACGWDLPAPPLSCFSFVGATIIIIGLYIYLFNGSFHFNSMFPDQTEAALVLMAIGCVPLVLSNAVKRHLLATKQVDLVQLNFWVSLLSCSFGFILCNVGFGIQYMGSDDTPRSDYSSLYEHLVGGFKCLVGVNSYDDDYCEVAVLWETIIFLLCMAGSRLSFFLILRDSRRETFVHQLSQIGTFVACLTMYSDDVRSMWSNAFTINGGPVVYFALPTNTSSVVYGLLLLFLGVYLITRRADIPGLEISEEEFWGIGEEQQPLLMPQQDVEEDVISAHKGSMSRPPSLQNIQRAITVPINITLQEESEDDVLDILDVEDNITHSNPGQDAMNRVASRASLAGLIDTPGSSKMVKSVSKGSLAGLLRTSKHPSFDDMTILTKSHQLENQEHYRLKRAGASRG